MSRSCLNLHTLIQTLLVHAMLKRLLVRDHHRSIKSFHRLIRDYHTIILILKVCLLLQLTACLAGGTTRWLVIRNTHVDRLILVGFVLLFTTGFNLFVLLLWWNNYWLTSSYRTVVVAIKERLNRRSRQHQRILFNLLDILVLPIVVLIRLSLVKVISILGWLVRRFHPLLKKALPIKLSHPYMLLHFLWPIQSQSITWFPL